MQAWPPPPKLRRCIPVVGPNHPPSCEWPVLPAGVDGEFVAVAAFACHSLAIRRDGSIACWGENDAGQADMGIWGYVVGAFVLDPPGGPRAGSRSDSGMGGGGPHSGDSANGAASAQAAYMAAHGQGMVTFPSKKKSLASKRV